MYPGSKVVSGVLLLAGEVHGGPGTNPHRVVLRVWDTDKRGMVIQWVVHNQFGPNVFGDGHYFRTLQEALGDFEKRSQGLGGTRLDLPEGW